MDISLRSYLTMSTAAVVGAGAIALTPALPSAAMNTVHLPAPAAAEVALAGTSIPWEFVISVVQSLSGGGFSLPDLSGVSAEVIRAVAVEFIKEAAPVVKEAAGEILQFVGSAVTGLVFGPDSIPSRIGSTIGDIPQVVKAAVGELKNGEFLAALATLNTGLLAPITAIGQVLAETLDTVKTFVATQVGNLTSALPGILMAAIDAVINNNGPGVLASLKDVVSGLFGGALPAAGAPRAAAALSPAAGASVTLAVPATVAEADAAPAAVVPEAPQRRAPRAAASTVEPRVADEPAVGSGQSPAEPASLAPKVDLVDAPAPATRLRGAAVRSAAAGEVAAGPAAERSKPTLRSGRSADRPRAAAAAR